MNSKSQVTTDCSRDPEHANLRLIGIRRNVGYDHTRIDMLFVVQGHRIGPSDV